jgi:hypothetical protein
MTDPNAGLPPMPPEPPGGAVTALDVASAQGFGSTPKGPPELKQPGPRSREEIEANQITEQTNPANDHEARMLRERGPRLSLNAPSRRLEVPPLEGYHLHWFLERNVPRALAGWYEYVDPKEVPSADRSIGGRTEGASSEDLGGSRIAQLGGTNERGLLEQLILMKIRQEYYFAEQRKIAERNLSIIQQVFHKKAPIMEPTESKSDYNQRYTREALLDMATGRSRKSDSRT